MSQLMYNTTYYVRAYAINDQGIGYGEEISFTTEDYGTRSTITYYASAKLTETEDANLAGLHTNAFDVPVIGHEFSNGVGVITFGGQVTRIGASAFKKCALMTKIDFPGAIIAIGDYAFYGCTWLQEVSLGNVKAVGRSAFEDCTNLATLICSQDMTVVSAYMCKGCTSLTLASMYNGIKTIDQGAFENCGLELVNIPATVNSIGLSAFYGNNLTSISCSAPSPPACQANTFSSFTAKLYVPAASVTAYSNADVWWNFAPNIFPLQE
jgi:hypothetical protein